MFKTISMKTVVLDISDLINQTDLDNSLSLVY